MVYFTSKKVAYTPPPHPYIFLFQIWPTVKVVCSDQGCLKVVLQPERKNPAVSYYDVLRGFNLLPLLTQTPFRMSALDLWDMQEAVS